MAEFYGFRSAGGAARTLLAFGLLLLSAAAPGGTIRVDSAEDNDNPLDATVTLREALAFARGDRAPTDFLDPDQEDEKMRVTGDVGAGSVDTIQINFGSATVNLASPLPPLDNLTDSIQAFANNILDGAALPANPNSAMFDLNTPGHTITGFTMRNFPSFAVRMAAANNTIRMMVIEDNRETAVIVTSGATGCVVQDVAIRRANGFGALVTSGANNNTFRDLFIHGCKSTGINITGAGTTGNKFTGAAVGVDENLDPGGNEGYGIWIQNGATANVIGDRSLSSAITFVSNNNLGGVLIEGAGTNGNVLDHVWIGFSETVVRGAGNGPVGHGLEVRGGAKNNQLGQPNFSSSLIISGHKGNGILIHGLGTDGNNIQRTFVGGENPYSGLDGPMINDGHGIEIRGGVKDMFLGALTDNDGASLNMDHTGGHGLFLNGDDPENAITGIRLNNYHFGQGTNEPPPIFGGDVIRLSGNVNDVVLGNTAHGNHTNGAAGWGVHISGPDVRNIRSRTLQVGVISVTAKPNAMGGVYIGQGAHDIEIGDPDPLATSIISGNTGPGVFIDATSGPTPHAIKIQNCFIGFDAGGSALGNTDGVIVRGDPNATSPTVITGLEIGGRETLNEKNWISGNNQNGIVLENISGGQIFGNFIGCNYGGVFPVPNVMDGIRLVNSTLIEIGDPTFPYGMNVISGNGANGIHVMSRSHTLFIKGNFIGARASGIDRCPNTGAGILIEPPGPPQGRSLEIGGARGSGGGLELGDGNLISGNDGPGVHVRAFEVAPSVERLTIAGNVIGLDKTGSFAIANGGGGIILEGPGVVGTLIGSESSDARGNIISGNQMNGLTVDGAVMWKAHRNRIGTDWAGLLPVGNLNGVYLADTQSGELGAKTFAARGNLISGNTEAGVRVGLGVRGEVVISNNTIGLGEQGDPLPNRDGIHVDNVFQEAGTLLIGEANPFIAQGSASLAERGNLISGNTRDGVRIENFGTASTGFRVVLKGNQIGVAANATEAAGNGEAGVRVTGSGGGRVFIGEEPDPESGNVISGNTMDGVLIEEAADHVGIFHNRIGSAGDPEIEIPNMRHGASMISGAVDTMVKKNTIYYNKESGVHAAGATTRRNTFRDNSIFRNEKKGITLADGANGGIKAPRLDYNFRPGMAGEQGIAGVAPASATLQFFEATLPPADKPGAWGQGKEPASPAEGQAGGDGAFTFLHGSHRGDGMYAVTATDAQGNTSEFSPVVSARVIQTVFADADVPADQPPLLRDQGPLLMANKPTAVRVYGATSKSNGGVVTAVGSATLGGSTAAAPINPHEIRRWGAYDGFAATVAERLAGADGLNFIVPAPPAGTQDLEVTLREGGPTGPFRGSFNLDSYLFQTGLQSQTLAILPLATTGSVAIPTPATLAQIITFFASVYPVEANTFATRNTVVLPVSASKLNPSNAIAVSTILYGFSGHRTRTIIGGRPARHLAMIFDLSVWDADIEGLSFPQLGSQSVILKDRLTASLHGGPIMAHEIGHTAPYGLGETYFPITPGHDRLFINPRWLVAPRYNPREEGNYVPEVDYGFDPVGASPGARGPQVRAAIPTEGANGLRVGPRASTEFMGNAVNSGIWIDAVTNRRLFQVLGGQLNAPAPFGAQPPRAAAPKLVSTPLVVSGLLNDDATAEIQPVFRPGGAEFMNEIQPENPTHSVELRGAGDALLSTRALTADFFTTQPSVPFEAIFPDDPGARRIVVKQGAAEIASLELNATEPTVMLTAPNGPLGQPGETIKVTWSASAGDGDTLFFDVLYTPDNGATVLPVATNLKNQFELDVDTRLLPGGDQARFIVEVSDGWNRVSDMSDAPLQIPDREPLVEIASPRADEMNLAAGVQLSLLAGALDPEDGFLSGDALKWYLDGGTEPVATGMNALVSFEQGAHTLRVTATDSFGHVVSDEVMIQVGPEPLSIFDLIDYLAGRRAAPAGGDVNSDGVIDTADLEKFMIDAIEDEP